MSEKKAEQKSEKEDKAQGKNPKEFMKESKGHAKGVKEEILDAQKKHADKHQEEASAKVDEKDAKIEELTDMLKRTQAEFINFKNRTEKETRHVCEFANADMIKRLLPVLDSFELALKNAPESEFKKGVELVYAQMLDAFKSEGLRPIEAVGKKFDTNYHEVMLKEMSDKPEDIVLEEFQKGYMLKDKVLRYTKVKVSAGNQV